ncbi:putative bifunctional diguanylate cyclase/phosphodiesterase [Actinoplanes sp. RD1]|uniref:putative bifunctional diguanylate cyclase/phosphodiesterase n=1 Tax=Actinoplanes sp. RD1 TaxID=3064538 RepID=UPI002740B78E|nr:EAL domain-containing protein [Actinoplanes sp. RD1]
MPTRLTAAVFGGWMLLLGAVFTFVDAARGPVRLLAGASTVAVILLAVRTLNPERRTPWNLLAAAAGVSAVGAVMLTGGEGLLRTAGIILLLGVYPLLAAVLVMFVRYRTGGRPDRGGLLDALTLTSGVALLIWAFVLGPHVRDPGLHTVDRVLAVLFPIGDLLCLAALTRLLLVTGRRLPSAALLTLGTLALLGTDIVTATSFGDHAALVAAFGRIPFLAAAGLAALHPSMIELTRGGLATNGDLGRIRLVPLALVSLIAPVVLVMQVAADGTVADLVVNAALNVATFLLVLARMAGVMASHRQAVARERGLREAAAALVSVADADEVGEAVRRALAQLLPADTPHQVVLALSYAAPGASAAPETAHQMDLDRAAGTAARLVSVRELDWAVATRMSQFPAVLRCPLVLSDRPAGDPLVGVLHVGGPQWALAALQSAVEVLATQVALALERIALSEEVIRRNSEAYFRTLVLNTSDVILIVDDHNRIRYASPSAGHVLGGDPVGVLLPELVHPGDRRRLDEVLGAVRSGDVVAEGVDFRAVGRRRTEVMLELHGRDLRADPTVAGLVITLRDVTERARLERELTHQAFHDSLTGLANRVLFTDRLTHALARGARDGSVVGVLFLDLDDFKIVNDTQGHAVGDLLLKAVAARLAGALRADDTAARLGGDEFAALVENVQDPGAVEETAARILAALAEPIPVEGGMALFANASIGITTTPEADTADELLRQADLALYVAKGAGKNQWRRYRAELHTAMVERLELRSALEHSVNEGHFILQYQPIVKLNNDEVVGFEALVRWAHPVRGVISPDQFIEVAEESGLIVPMGRWVLDQALHTVAQWWRILPRVRRPYVSVNVSVRQFRQPGFVDQVRQSLEYVGMPPHALMLEITETLLMGDDEQIWTDLALLRELGVRIAIDDFGTGYSSLGYLRQRPIDVLKIDKMFIDDMVSDKQQLALVSGIVSLAQSLGLTVVAEGIEHARHRGILSRLGCPLGQGYYYSPPLGETEALSWLRNPRVSGEDSEAA